jgi:hypothetical protein
MKKNLFFALAAFAALSLTSCKKDNEGTARLQVRLTDAPGNYQAVHVDIRGIEINSGDGETGWVALQSIRPGVYDLLKLTGGLDTLLATEELPAGRISQIRLILGENNSVKTGGQVYALKTPSAQQSGLKLKLNANLTEGVTYTILLDFDAARSVVSAGNSGGFNLKPVIRSIVEAQSGAIKGSVTPALAAPAVYAISGTDTVSTAYADATGTFLLRGVKPGTYQVVIQPKEGYQVHTTPEVSVTLGNVTTLTPVALAAE